MVANLKTSEDRPKRTGPLLAGMVAALLLAMPFAIWGQAFPEVGSAASAFTTDLIGLNEGFVLFHWQKFIDQHGGITRVPTHEKGVYLLESQGVRFPGIDALPVTVYARLSPDPILSGVQLTLWIRLADGAFLRAPQQPGWAGAVQDWLEGFNAHLRDLDRQMLAGSPDARMPAISQGSILNRKP